MTKFFSTFIFLVIVSATITAQVGINTASPNASAALDITSTDKGLLIPRVASTANVTAPTAGMMVYQTGGTAGFYFYNGSWNLVGGGSGDNLGNHTATQTLNMANKNISNADTIRTDVLRSQEFFYDLPTTTVTFTSGSSLTSAQLDATGKTWLRFSAPSCSVHGLAGGVHGKVVYLIFAHSSTTFNYHSSTETNASNRFSDHYSPLPTTPGPSANWFVKLMYDQTLNGGTGRWVVIDWVI
jgi:hypothetical protein